MSNSPFSSWSISATWLSLSPNGGIPIKSSSGGGTRQAHFPAVSVFKTRKKGRLVKLMVRDSSGKAVCAEVTVCIDEGQFLDLPLGLPAKTDAEGNWTWNCAPVKPCSYRISADGFDTVLRDLPPGEHTITLKRPGFVIGRVIDAETKKPIERFFVSRKKVIENDYFTLSDSDWKNLFVADASDGVFRCVCPEGPKFHVTRTFTVDAGDGPETVELPEPKYLGVIFRIEAEGYLPATTKTLPWQEENVEVTFEMKKAAPIAGRIIDAKGRPVAGAEIVVVGEDLPAVDLDAFEHDGFDLTDWPSQDEFLKEEADRNGIVFSSEVYEANEAVPKQPRHTRSDKDGVFTLFPQTAPYELVVVHKDGIACVDSGRFKSSRDIVLNEWASIEGVVLVDDKPLPNTEIEIDPSASPSTVTVNFGFASCKTPLVQIPATRRSSIRLPNPPLQTVARTCSASFQNARRRRRIATRRRANRRQKCRASGRQGS